MTLAALTWLGIHATVHLAGRIAERIRWNNSAPSDDAVRETAARIRAALDRDDARPSLNARPTVDPDVEKRLAWERAR